MFRKTALAIAIACASSVASAAVWTDTVTSFENGGRVTTSDDVQYQHNILDDGFVLGNTITGFDLKIWLRAARATPARDGALAASPIDRTLRVVGIGIEDSERVILASDGPLCETEAIALRDIDRSIDLDSGEPIADLWQWLKTRDPSPDGPIH